MTPDELELLAIQKKPTPDTTPLPDSCWYWTMRQLHELVRAGKLSRDCARAEKQRALRHFREFQALYEESGRLYKQQQEHIRKAGELVSEMNRAEDLHTAAMLAFEIIGRMTGDTVSAEHNRKRFGGNI